MNSKLVESVPLLFAALVNLIGAGFLWFAFRYDIPGIVMTLFITNSLGLMCLDFYEEDNKPIWTAVFRAIPIFAAYISYLHAKNLL